MGSGFVSVGVGAKLGTCRRVSIATGEGSREGSIDCSMWSPEFSFGQFLFSLSNGLRGYIHEIDFSRCFDIWMC